MPVSHQICQEKERQSNDGGQWVRAAEDQKPLPQGQVSVPNYVASVVSYRFMINSYRFHILRGLLFLSAWKNRLYLGVFAKKLRDISICNLKIYGKSIGSIVIEKCCAHRFQKHGFK